MTILRDIPLAGFRAHIVSFWDGTVELWRKLSLVKQFSLAASAVVLLGMFTIGSWVAERIKSGVIQSSAAAAALQMDNFIAPLVQDLRRSPTLSDETLRKLDTFIQQMVARRVVSVKVWGLDGSVVYSNWRELIGHRFPMTGNLSAAIKGSIVAELESRPHEGPSAENHPVGVPLLEIYAPIRNADTGQVIAVAEYYSIERELVSELHRAAAWSWLVVGLVTLIMMSGLFGIVLTGSRTIDAQKRRLQSQISELKSLLDQNQDLRDRVQRAHQRSARINEQVLRRVGADLHDGPAQLVSLALLLLHSLKAPGNSLQQNADVERIRAALDDTMREIRGLSSGLMLPEIGKSSLDQVVQMAVQAHASRTGTKVACQLALTAVEVPEPLKVCAYRFVQEALNNAFKHGHGRGQSVDARGDETRIVLMVSDQGPGLRSEGTRSDTDGLGLIGLRDRIETLGGQLEITPASDGFTLKASFDLRETRRLEASDATHDQHSRR